MWTFVRNALRRLLHAPGAAERELAAQADAEDRNPKAPPGAGPQPKTAVPRPSWFNPNPGPVLRAALQRGKPIFLYIPYDCDALDALPKLIRNDKHYLVAPLDLVGGELTAEKREQVLAWVLENPISYARLVRERLAPIRRHISGLIFRDDLAPATRIISQLCESLQLPRLLIPDAFAGLDPHKSTSDPVSHASVPAADMVFGSGPLQKEAFVARGFPQERYEAVGSLGVDGEAAKRIKARLAGIAHGRDVVTLRESAVRRALRGESLDVVCCPSSNEVLNTSQKYVAPMLRARTVLHFANDDTEFAKFAAVDVFYQWGIARRAFKRKQAALARRLGRAVLIIEDGFLRSVDIGLSGTPTLSIILDDLTAYYDATKPSRLATLLAEEPPLPPLQRRRARLAMEAIRKYRLSKYNHAPDIPILPQRDRPRLLLVDQRFGDQSVASGLADETTFEAMVADVLETRAGYDILVKLHPDAITGGKGCYLTPERIPALARAPNVHVIDYDVNPHALFDAVDEVHVVTSGLGFEALMAGRSVFCHGMPFYAGWGVTHDKMTVEGRGRARDLEEIFHYAYIELSRYYSPALGRACEVEDVIAYLAAQLQARGRVCEPPDVL